MTLLSAVSRSVTCLIVAKVIYLTNAKNSYTSNVRSCPHTTIVKLLIVKLLTCDDVWHVRVKILQQLQDVVQEEEGVIIPVQHPAVLALEGLNAKASHMRPHMSRTLPCKQAENKSMREAQHCSQGSNAHSRQQTVRCCKTFGMHPKRY